MVAEVWGVVEGVPGEAVLPQEAGGRDQEETFPLSVKLACIVRRQKRSRRLALRLFHMPESVPLCARTQRCRLEARSHDDAINAASNAAGLQAAKRLHASLETLATLLHHAVADNGASKGRCFRILSRLARLHAGLALDNEVDDNVNLHTTNHIVETDHGGAETCSADPTLFFRARR